MKYFLILICVSIVSCAPQPEVARHPYVDATCEQIYYGLLNSFDALREAQRELEHFLGGARPPSERLNELRGEVEELEGEVYLWLEALGGQNE